MFTLALGHRGRTTHHELVRAKAAGFAAVLGVLVLAGVAASALVILADSNSWHGSSNSVDCPRITGQADRLACYDKLARRPIQHPFRGANMPAPSHSF
jgi:hypothetical protein